MPYDFTYKRNLMNKINEQNRTRGKETRNKLTVAGGEEGGKEGEGSSQGTCMNDPWRTGCRVTVGVGGVGQGKSNRGKIGTAVIE